MKSLARELGVAEGVAWVADPEDIFKDPEVVAVDVSTPTQAHADLITRALQSGKDFFCEKPISETLEEAKMIQRLVRDTGRIGMMGYVYRFCPVFERARDILGDAPTTGVSPVLGRLTCATMRIGGRGSHVAWKHLRGAGGGATTEMLVHMLDLALWYFGRILRIDAVYEDVLRPRRFIQGAEVDVDADDFVLVRLMTESGVPVLIQADLVTPSFTQFVEIQGDNGSFHGSIQSEVSSYVYTLSDAEEYTQGRTDILFGQVNLFEAQMARFVEAVRLRHAPTQGTIDAAVEVMDVLENLRMQREKGIPRFLEV